MIIHESLRPAMINTAGLVLFCRLVIFSLKVFHLHRKNWAGVAGWGKACLINPIFKAS